VKVAKAICAIRDRSARDSDGGADRRQLGDAFQRRGVQRVVVLGDFPRRIRALDQGEERGIGAVERDERLGHGIDQPVGRQAGVLRREDAARGLHPAVAAEGRDLARRLAADPAVTGVTSYWAIHAPALRAEDSGSAMTTGLLRGDDDAVARRSGG
jgi:hypothetical protein